VKDYKAKFKILMELIELSERAFIFKLKKKRPNITEQEIELELRSWYQDRPGAEHGDGVGVPGDPSRFDK
jgi:hypothetical protein